jgi:histone H3/H4
MTSRSFARNDSEDEELRAALQYSIAQICTQEEQESSDGVQVTKGAILTLTELTFLYATTSLANDLAAFSQHANRRTITSDDVLLIARKNPDSLQAKLNDFARTEGFGQQQTSSLATLPAETAELNLRKKTPPKSGRNPRLGEGTLLSTDSEQSSNESLQSSGLRNESSNNQSSELHMNLSSTDMVDGFNSGKENRKPTEADHESSCTEKRDSVNDLLGSSDDDPPISQFKRRKIKGVESLNVLVQKKTMDKISAVSTFSSDEDSVDF